MFNTGCIICGSELEYRQPTAGMNCSVCGKPFQSSVQCKNGHYVCDSCHQSGAIEYIDAFCSATNETDPVRLAVEIMKNPKIKMHGPEHHFLVPAVLIACYYNTIGKRGLIKEKLAAARERAGKILGGFCGFYGTCGAGVGTGIFMSLILDATPLSSEEWRLCNLITARSLEVIALHGGPRCCKRDTFLAIENAVSFLKENLNVVLHAGPVRCSFSDMNKQCRKEQCRYYSPELG